MIRAGLAANLGDQALPGTLRRAEDCTEMTNDIELQIDDDPAWDADPNPELVHWQPTHSPDGTAASPVRLSPAGALGLVGLGSVVVGAVAVGALAIGAVAIGRLAVGQARFRRLEIDELVVGRLILKD